MGREEEVLRGAILVTLFAGLGTTMGIGLAMVGVFNIISIAFIALFVGLGVDFGIQFAVRYRHERHHEDQLATAQKKSATMPVISMTACLTTGGGVGAAGEPGTAIIPQIPGGGGVALVAGIRWPTLSARSFRILSTSTMA